MINLNVRVHPIRALLLGLLLCAATGEVMATLGQAPSAGPSVSSPAPDAKMLAATVSVPSSLYTLHSVELENGTVVREYATSAGRVFAVSWRGPVLPDLSALLGGYFNTLKRETEQARLRGRRGGPVSLEQAGLVVRSNGRMRNFFGHAYAPDLVPAGVNIKDVLQ